MCLLAVLCCVCGVLGHLAPVHRCACSMSCFACAVSWASWLQIIDVPARSVVVRVRCPGPLGSCSPVRPLGVFVLRGRGLAHLAPVHWCARLVCCVAYAVSWATWLLFTGAPGRCVASRVRCPRPLGSCSSGCPLGVLFCVCGVLGHLAPVHRCARVVSFASAVSSATWLLFTGVLARCVLLRVRCPGPLGSRSSVLPLGVLRCVCGVLSLLAPVHRCARSVCCFACAVSWASWLLLTDVPARCVVLRVRCPWPPGSCSPVRLLDVLLCVCGVLGLLAPDHRCARSVCCVTCAVSWATWVLFTSAPAGCVVLRGRGLGHLAPVHWCARWVCCVACAVSWATWPLFTGAPGRCVALRVRCPRPLGSCSSGCPLGVLFCVCSVLGDLAPVHRCARSVGCVACAVSGATWLLLNGVPARCVLLCVRCPGRLGSCSPVCPFGALCCVGGVLGHLAPVHLCARSVGCFACAASWATWLLFTGVPTGCVVLRVRCPGPRGSCSPVCPLSVLCCVCGVLGHLAHVHQCARSVLCFAHAVSWATWLLFTSAPARCVVLRALSWATWLLFTGVPARCVVFRVRCPGQPGSCSPVCPLGGLFCVYGVLGYLTSVHRCARFTGEPDPAPHQRGGPPIRQCPRVKLRSIASRALQRRS